VNASAGSTRASISSKSIVQYIHGTPPRRQGLSRRMHSTSQFFSLKNALSCGVCRVWSTRQELRITIKYNKSFKLLQSKHKMPLLAQCFSRLTCFHRLSSSALGFSKSFTFLTLILVSYSSCIDMHFKIFEFFLCFSLAK
jgi:hypothetical protein